MSISKVLALVDFGLSIGIEDNYAVNLNYFK